MEQTRSNIKNSIYIVTYHRHTISMHSLCFGLPLSVSLSRKYFFLYFSLLLHFSFPQPNINKKCCNMSSLKWENKIRKTKKQKNLKSRENEKEEEVGEESLMIACYRIVTTIIMKGEYCIVFMCVYVCTAIHWF